MEGLPLSMLFAFLIALLAFCLGGSPSSRRLSLRSLRKDGDETMISDNESSPSVTFPWPTSLQNWRIQPNGYAIERWNSLPLMTFFYESGYRLWLPSALSPLSLYTPTRVSRIHDGFAYLANYPEGPKINSLNEKYSLSYGDITGNEHWHILDRLSIGDVSYRGNNHVVPVLQTLTFQGLHFAVFPLMWPHNLAPWFWNVGELVEFLFQIIEGIHFFHKKKITHLDIAEDNILINFARGSDSYWSEDRNTLYPFRAHFPIWYYINDFELGQAFDENEDTPLLSDFPNVRRGGDRADYARCPAPEMIAGKAYNPFLTDIWQCGNMVNSMLTKNVGDDWRIKARSMVKTDKVQTKLLLNLLERLTDKDPGRRPSSKEALELITYIKISTMREWNEAFFGRHNRIDI